ncbi:MAG TPA: pitrilysin family protein [Thermoanaerobaculia bacterium]|nr:pitrilysin family protein [Thermoanaerobaculia bacterium]
MVQPRPEVPPALPGIIRHQVLANGLTLCRVESRNAPVVTCALFYRAGARDEEPGLGGTAHFLEHMMFKGSRNYGPGEIDRLTQALGGVNNAFTSHDLTAYYFDFAADRWTEALAIEVDRMENLTLDPDEVASERQVILEEISMSASDPWDALETEAMAALFQPHPYGRPVLGTEADLLRIGRDELAAFHARFYRPENAVLVIGGDVGPEAEAAARACFAPVAGGRGLVRMPPPAPAAPTELVRVTRRQGEVPRLLLLRLAPHATHPSHPALRLLVTVLGGGRASRLHRALVDEGQICSWVSVDVAESLETGFLAVAAELVPGEDPARAEEVLFAELERLSASGPSEEEVERAKQIAVADWIFGHERVHQQALALGGALTLFDLRHPERQLGRLLAADQNDLKRAAARWLDPGQGGVLGWSLPAEPAGRPS